MKLRIFLIVLLVLVGGAAIAYQFVFKEQVDALIRGANKVVNPPPPEPEPRTPLDYMILEDHGGIPMVEAQKAGLSGPGYAYLRTMSPTGKSKNIEVLESATVGTRRYELGYIMAHNNRDHIQFIEFNLGGQWDELHFGFGFDDSHPSDPTGKDSIKFTLRFDGKDIIGPETMTPVSKPIFTMRDVRGVNRVSFVIDRNRQFNEFDPVIIDPFVLKVDDAAPDSAPAEN